MATVLTTCRTRVVLSIKQNDNTAGVNTSTSLKDVAGAQKSWGIGTTSANSVNASFVPATITLTAGNTTTIDLSNGTANKTPTNQTLVMARTKIFYIAVADGTGLVNGVLVNGLAANSNRDLYITIPIGGKIYLEDPSATGVAVAGTTKNLALKNLDASNSVNVTVVVVGSNA